MASLETALSVISAGNPRHGRRFPILKSFDSLKLPLSLRSPSSPCLSLVSVSPIPTSRSTATSLQLCFSVQEMAVEAETEDTQEQNIKRKLYVVNLPWSLSVVDIKNLFGECGTVKDVEIIKQKDGKSRGFAFVTMGSGEEAQAVVEKFDSYEISGRIIRVEFAKRFRRPTPSPPSPAPPAGETRHKLYISNLAWKARSTHLREVFSENFNPISARVVFESPSGRSAGYGFVSFATREEAETALSALDGKELMGRPLRLKLSEKNVTESDNEKDGDGETSVVQSESS